MNSNDLPPAAELGLSPQRGTITYPQARRASAFAIVVNRERSLSYSSDNKMAKSKIPNPWDSFLGDCRVVDRYLEDKPKDSLVWAPAHFLNIFLRAIGQPAFVNNPILGAVMFASFFLRDPMAGLGCLMGGGIATIAELVLGLQSWSMLRNGVGTFNGCLVGLVGAGLYPVIYQGVDRPPALWAFMAVGALASIFVSKALDSFLGRAGLPYLALPFNLIIACIFLTLKPDDATIAAIRAASATATTTAATTTATAITTTAAANLATSTAASAADPEAMVEGIDWLMASRGVLVSISQIWGINDVTTSFVILVTLLLFSPLLTLTLALGGVMGSGLGLCLLPADRLWEVYAGIWGYNPMLTTAALSCVFYPLSVRSSVMSFVGAASTFAVQWALRENMREQNEIPVFTFPMVLTCLVFLLVSNESGSLARTEEVTYPERQLMQWRRERSRIGQLRKQLRAVPQVDIDMDGRGGGDDEVDEEEEEERRGGDQLEGEDR